VRLDGNAGENLQVFLILGLNHGWSLDGSVLEEVETFATLDGIISMPIQR
jgi:hypothetical protein